MLSLFKKPKKPKIVDNVSDSVSTTKKVNDIRTKDYENGAKLHKKYLSKSKQRE